ncbi:MAG TPA: GxxExxY protein [Rhodospirillaceae bacterium]|nr:GxxExxY protein [Rhodospirillaceae bacterium]
MTDDNNITNFPDLGPALTRDIIGCAIKVHKYFGPGLLESIYEECLAIELAEKGFQVQKQLSMPVRYYDHVFENAYRIDLWVNQKVIIELKAVEKVLPVHEAQILSYMKLSKSPLGLLINFNEKLLKDGIKRYALTEFAGE